MVGDGQILADGVLKIVVLLVVRDVVDAVGREVAADIGGAGAFAAAPEGIAQTVHNLVIAERGGRIVEIAADDDGVGTLVNVGANRFGLMLPCHVGRRNLVREHLGLVVEGGVVRARPQRFAGGVVRAVKVHRGEVDVVNPQRVAVEADVHIHGLVARRVGSLHKAPIDNPVFAEHGHAELVTQLVAIGQHDLVRLFVVLDIQRVDDGLRGVESRLPGVVVAVFLNAQDVGLFVLQEMDELPVERHLVVAVDVESFGVVAHHLQAVGANLRFLNAAELKVSVYIIDVQKDDGNGDNCPSEIHHNPDEGQHEVHEEQIGKEKTAVGHRAGK